MKKIISLIACLLLFSFQTEKETKISQKTITKIHSCFSVLYNYLDKSNMPHQEVQQLKDMIIDADTTLKRETK